MKANPITFRIPADLEEKLAATAAGNRTAVILAALRGHLGVAEEPGGEDSETTDDRSAVSGQPDAEAADPDAEQPPPDVRALLRERLEARPLLKPLREILDAIAPAVTIAEDGSTLVLDPQDGGEAVALDEAALDNLLASETPTRGMGGGGGHGRPTVPTRPKPEPDPWAQLGVRIRPGGIVEANLNTYEKLSPAQRNKIEEGLR